MPEKAQEYDLDQVPKVVYHPKYKETPLERFKKMVEKEYKLKFNDYWEFHEWSYKNYPEFWDCVWCFFDIVHSKPYSQVYDRKNGFENMHWFIGAEMNFSQNLLKYRDSKTAIISTDADDNTEYISYKDLYDEVAVYIKALKDEGIKKGDYVACYMSNKAEAVFAFLAAAAIGAIFCGALPLLGVKAVLSRFEQIKPKILITAGNFKFDNKEFKMDERIPELVRNLPCLQKVVFCPKKGKKVQEAISSISDIPKCVYIKDFLCKAREEFRENATDIEFEQLPFDYPLCVSFTSGTTGAPKGLIHSTGSFIVTLRDFGLHQNCTREDVIFNQSPVGWISWNMAMNALHLGLTAVIYDGYVFQESPMRFWDLVDKFGLTTAFAWSSTLDFMDTHGWTPTSKHSLKTLRQLFPIGSPAKPSTFDFISEKVKPGLFCSPAYGTTEVFGLISGLDSNMPVYRGEIQAIGLGMDVRILDEKGVTVMTSSTKTRGFNFRSLRGVSILRETSDIILDNPTMGKRGELVLANPYPAFPVAILNDQNKEKVRELYLTDHPGYWNVADDAWRNPITKGFIIFGRSDETMNPNGARYNCSDIYFALEDFPGIKDSVVVSQYNKEMDERVALFLKMLPGHPLTDEVKKKINKTIEHHLTHEHVPDIILETPDIPYNLNGKKLNGIVKKLINKKPVQNSESVINPSSLEFYRNVDLGKF